ncbi:MAG TPA: glucokinase [Longimicrobiales bacterium]|nr:glucokinase [Longimicrobiales bacterium]
MTPRTGPGARIVGDFGGTNARLATLGDTDDALERITVLACADYPHIHDTIRAYLDRHEITEVERVCLAVAGPVDADVVRLPNNGWRFSRKELEATLGAPLTVINDFTAQALCVQLLHPGELSWIGAPRPRPDGIQVVIGPGTGLGVAVRLPSGEVVPSEGGHVGFAPTNTHEIELLRVLLERFGRVSIERLVSGPGLENLYWARSRLDGDPAAGSAPTVSAQDVSALAEAGDERALRSVNDLLDLLATFAGDMALANWATGGVYLSGGALRKLMGFLKPERFRARFEAKGRFSGFCADVGVAWIAADHPGLVGCAAALATGYASDGGPRTLR